MKNSNQRAAISRQSGFTLIELVVVIAIIATLTALSTFNFNQARIRARDVQRKSELKQIQNALELYKNDHFPQRFPTDEEGLSVLIPPTGNYMSVLPRDPKVKAQSGSWVDYVYDNLTSSTFTLTACLENTGDLDKTSGSCLGGITSGVPYQLTQP